MPRHVAALVALLGLALAAPAGAAAPAPRLLTDACAAPTTHALRLVARTAACRRRETRVRPYVSPIAVCVRTLDVRLASARRCRTLKGVRATLPPVTGSVRLCAERRGGKLHRRPQAGCGRRRAVTARPDTAPLARPDAGRIAEDGVLAAPAPGVLANDVDAEGAPLTATLVAGPRHAASFRLRADGSYTYRPAPDYHGADAFTYRARAGRGTSTLASVTLDVASVIDPPTAADDAITAIGNTLLAAGTAGASTPSTRVPSLLANDAGDGVPVSAIAGARQTAQGVTVIVSADGSFTYAPPVGFTGTDTFAYTVTDGARTDVATVTLTVAERVWYVDATAGPGGDGRSTAPFDALADVGGAGADADGPGDTIYLEGAGPYVGGIALEPGQRLAGGGAPLELAGQAVAPAGVAAVLRDAPPGPIVDLAEGAVVQGVAIEATTGAGIRALGIDAATVAASATVTAATGFVGVVVSGGGGDLAIDAPITQSSPAYAVLAFGRTGGTLSFGGRVSGSGTVDLSGNAGATIAFSGGLALATGSADALAARDGGTLVVTGDANTLATTTGTPLAVTDVAIGGAGLRFRSIAASGAPNGIRLERTGGAGRLVVTGDGTDASGGAIAHASGPGVLLVDGRGPSLTDMRVTDGADDGLRATRVDGLDLTRVQVVLNGDALGERGLDLVDQTGPTTVADGGILGSHDDQLRLETSGQASLHVLGMRFEGVIVDGTDGIDLATTGGTGTIAATITQTGLLGTVGRLVALTSAGGGIDTLVLDRAVLESSSAFGLATAGVDVRAESGHARVAVRSTQIDGSAPGGSGIRLRASGGGTAEMAVTGTELGNARVTMTRGIDAEAGEDGHVVLRVDGGSLQMFTETGLRASVPDLPVRGTLDLTVAGTAIDVEAGQTGMLLQSGDVGGGAGPSVCADVTGTTITTEGAAAGARAMRLRQFGSGVLGVARYPGTPYDEGTIASYLAGRNTLTGPGDVPSVVLEHPLADPSPAACTQPVLP